MHEKFMRNATSKLLSLILSQTPLYLYRHAHYRDIRHERYLRFVVIDIKIQIDSKVLHLKVRLDEGASMAQRLRDTFLEKAACFLTKDTPSTSAFLMAERLDVLSASNLAVSLALKATCCLACGCLLLPGWTATQARENSHSYPEKRIDKPGRQGSRKNIVRRCRSCHRKSTMAIKKPSEPKGRNVVTSRMADEAKDTTQRPSVAKSTAKQRAKDRKSNQGLQALMSSKDKQKIAASTATFDLMDFMQA